MSELIPEQFAVGSRLRGQVVLRKPFGVFVQVAEGIVGLVKLPNAGGARNTPDTLPAIGAWLDCEVIAVEIVNGALKLNLRNCTPTELQG